MVEPTERDLRASELEGGKPADHERLHARIPRRVQSRFAVRSKSSSAPTRSTSDRVHTPLTRSTRPRGLTLRWSVPHSPQASRSPMTAEASQANVVARMFENLSKCLTENAALLRELHARGQSGGAPGPSGGVPGPSASEEAPSSTKKRKADEAAKPKQVRTLSAYMLFMAAERDAVKRTRSRTRARARARALGRALAPARARAQPLPEPGEAGAPGDQVVGGDERAGQAVEAAEPRGEEALRGQGRGAQAGERGRAGGAAGGERQARRA